jgi:ABC-type amino acid transport substrate-binding protein
VSENGRDGLDVELIRLFAEHLGVEYEYVHTSWENVIVDLTGIEFVTEGENVTVVGETPIKGDIIANGFTILPMREKMVDYSIPTFPTQIWLVARSDCQVRPIKPSGDIDKDILNVRSLLKGQRLMGKPNTCLDPALYTLEETGADIILFEGNPEELVPAILRDEGDLSLLDMPDALIALDRWPGAIKVIGPLSHLQSMACAFPKGDPSLRESFNQFFEGIVQNGTYLKLVKKYYPSFSVYYPEYFSDRFSLEGSPVGLCLVVPRDRR